MKQWYVVHTHFKNEALALTNLRRQGFDVYLPQYLKSRRHARRSELVSAPLFPRYLFVYLDIEAVRWRAIKYTIGVQHIICNGERPAPVPDGVVEDIKAHENDAGKVVLGRICPFKKNQLVKINTGALSDHSGLFDCASDDQRVFILLELMGRMVRVRVPMETISAVA